MAIIGAAAIGAAGSIGGAAISSGGKSNGGSQQQQASGPWDPQQQYITQGFGDAQNIYQDRLKAALPTGPWTAYENDQQRNAAGGAYTTGMAAGQGGYGLGGLTNTGNVLATGAMPYLTNAEGISQSGLGGFDGSTNSLLSNYAKTGTLPGQASTISQSLMAGVSNGAATGLGSIGQAQGLAGQVAENSLNPAAALGATQSGASGLAGSALGSNLNGASAFAQGSQNAALGSASSYANSAGLDAQIDAANRDVNRDLTENTLPQLRAAAMASGNTNSSREGALEAISTRGAADRMADTAAAMRGQAFNTGAALGSNAYSTGAGLNSTAFNNGASLGNSAYLQGQNTALGAAGALNVNGSVGGNLATSELGRQTGLNEFGTTSQLGAAQNAYSNSLNGAVQNTNAQLQGNAQLGTGLNIGQNAALGGLQGTLAGYQAAQGAGTFQQQQDQLPISDSLQQFNANDQRQQSVLNDYWNLVGSRNWGSQSDASSFQLGGTGSMIRGALGGGLAAYGAYKNMSGSQDPFNGNGYSGGLFGPSASELFSGPSWSGGSPTDGYGGSNGWTGTSPTAGFG